MKRSLIALGASTLALALNTAPAAAQAGDPGQQIGDSIGAAQVGAVQADVPVRVLSDGDNAEPAGVTATPQDSGGSPTPGSQNTTDSTGAAQAGPVDVDAPVRVLSEGDDGATATVADTTPSGDPPAGGDNTAGDTVPAIGGGPADDTTPAVDEPPALDPVAEAEPGNGDGGTLPDGAELLPIAAGDVAGDVAGELPLTGLAVASLVLTGIALITGGGALHCVPSRH